MADLTAEQIQKAETMPLEELRALALKEAEDAVVPPPKTEPEPKTPARDKNGRFVEQGDEIDNSADPDPDADPDGGEVTTTIFRKEIENGNGSVDVYEANSLEELVDKIAEGKRNANKQIQEFISERKAAEAKTQQVSKDEEYLIQQKLKDNPKSTIKEVVAEVIEERMAATKRSEDAQSHFVTTHPDYIASPENGERMKSEVQRLGYAEFTIEGLEKAYQGLKKSGLLVLKPADADGATEAARLEAERTAQAQQDAATQQRSSKKASTISTRSRSTTTNVNTQPTLDEAYSMPLDKLRELANKQLADNNG